MSDKKIFEEVKVSIIIPVYNIENYIEKCLKSIEEQLYSCFEVIIINDGSTDDTKKICTEFAAKDSRFNVFNRQNAGVSSARNLGLSISKGKYICFVDGDDYLSKNYLDLLVRYMESEEADIVCADYYLDVGGQIIVHSQETITPIIFFNKDAINKLSDKNLYQGYLWNKIFKQELITTNNIKFDERVKIWEDMLFCLNYLAHSNKVLYVQVPIYYYVQRQNSAINTSSIWTEHTHLYALEQMWVIAKDYEGDFKEYIRNFYANDLVGQLCKNKKASYTDIHRQLVKIESLNANLTFKHKLKKVLVKMFPRLIQNLYAKLK